MTETGQARDGAAEMARRRTEHERAERLKSLRGHRLTPRSPSDFQKYGLPALRAMIEHASAGAIETSGRHWRSSADRLGGDDGHGGIRKAFQDAVEHAAAHWEGSAAQAFRREAAKVLAKIDRSYQHARNVESTLIGTRSSGPEVGVAHNLREAQKALVKLQLAGAAADPMEAAGDESQFKRDMANPKLDTRMALELNRASLPPSKQRQIEAVIVMDELAAHYEAQGERLREGTGQGVEGDWPVAPSGSPAPPPVNAEVTGGPAPHHPPTAQRPNGAGGGAVPAGFDSPRADRPSPDLHPQMTALRAGPPPVTTGLESVGGGTLTAPPAGGHAVGAGTPPGGQSGPAPAGGGLPNNAVVSGVIGVTGGGLPTGGTRGAGRGSGGARRSAGGTAGSPDAVAARGATPPRTPAAPTARPEGPAGPAGGSKQGGAGLHRSRGGARATAADPASTEGKGGRGKGEPSDKGGGRRRSGGPRSRDLDEDETTGAPPRQIPPPVIE
ncbi:hypothetical protein [Streptomyces sp. 769]|uniref:hypothetical protein n=1 Tax=Streptomyces sp. 769 TaxID=1262452 RepID=UPI000580B0C3|nr:hypothetical protein [Streptomyces sp. 769]AJC56414.1 hypothetical protein GZL_03828 [Streptomyces sp. 769]